MTTLVKKVATGALAALTLGGATLASATPAAAQHRGGYYGGYHGGYHGGYGRGYGGAGLAIAGLAGLAVGAAVASERPYYGGGYGYYGAPYPGYGYGYDAPGYAYGPGYYYGGPRYYYRYHRRCGPYRCW